MSKTPQGAAAAAAGKAAAKARLEARDAEMEELVSQGLSWDEIEAKIPPQDGKSVTAGGLDSYWRKSAVCTLSPAKRAATKAAGKKKKAELKEVAKKEKAELKKDRLLGDISLFQS